jgi:Reverse transcriptase (RNA-dependent DNA polymerase)
VKIQNDCSEYFETRQGLRQGDVLSTLFFNVVLEIIVRRAKLQTNGTIFNRQTQILAYADDIDIIGKPGSRPGCLPRIGERSEQSRNKDQRKQNKVTRLRLGPID